MSHPNPSSAATDFESIFELAPVSLWLEDFSELKRFFDRLRHQGVQDLATHLAEHPELVAEGAACIRVLRVNAKTLSLFGANDAEHLLANLGQVFRDDMLAAVVGEWSQLWNGQLEFMNQTVNYTLDGRRLDVLVRARILQGHEAEWDRVMVSLEDVSDTTRNLQRLASSEQYARDLFEHSPVSLWVEDFSAVKQLLDEARRQGITDFPTFIRVHPEFVTRCMQEIRVVDVNQLTLGMFGAQSKGELLSRLDQLFRGEMVDSFSDQLIDLWQNKLVQHREVTNYTLNGDKLHIHMQFSVLDGHEDDWSLVLVSLVDITARKKAEAYLEYLGKHDVLTRLRNRAFYADELNRLARRGPWPVSVLIVDLNGLKLVNDEEGHAAGDAMLRRAGEVLGKAVDAPACAARIGGDEFALLLPASDARAAVAVQERIQSLLEMNNQFYPGQPLTLSMGAATCQDGESLDAAVSRADQAMYAAKARYYQNLETNRRSSP
ncbi:MAG: GGDEF domain-containing protein [Curvibacter sp.]|nr:MAG: GGDEF domain-containing protein [Curvibacter sp.]